VDRNKKLLTYEFGTVHQTLLDSESPLAKAVLAKNLLIFSNPLEDDITTVETCCFPHVNAIELHSLRYVKKLECIIWLKLHQLSIYCRYKMAISGQSDRKFHFSKEPLQKVYSSWLFRKQHMAIPAFNTAFLRLSAAGLIDKYYEKAFVC